MIASLYHSGSSVKRRPARLARAALAFSALLALFGLRALCPVSPWPSPTGASRWRNKLLSAGISISNLSCAQAPNGIRTYLRIEAERLASSAPDEAALAQQVFHLQAAVVRQAEAFQGQIDVAVLGLERIEANRHQHHVVAETCALAACAGGLDEVEDALVAHAQETHAQMRLQGRVFGAELVQPGHVVDDVAGPLPVPGADFVLLGVEVFLLAGHRLRFAQFETAVDAPQARQGRGQRRPYLEAGAAGTLQELGVDVGRVDKEMRPIKIARLVAAAGVGGQFGQVVDELLLAVAPGEISIGLRKTQLGQAIHGLGPGEGFRQEDHLRIA